MLEKINKRQSIALGAVLLAVFAYRIYEPNAPYVEEKAAFKGHDQPQLIAEEIAQARRASSAFSTRQLGSGISIDLPKDWSWFGEADAHALNTASKAKGRSIGIDIDQGDNRVLVAGNAFNDAGQTVATVRVSSRRGGALSQTQLREAFKEAPSEIEAGVAEAGLEVANQLSADSRAKYYRLVGSGVRENASMMCLWTRFEFDIGHGATLSDTWVCPSGNEKLKFNASYLKSRENIYSPIVDYVWESFKIL